MKLKHIIEIKHKSDDLLFEMRCNLYAQFGSKMFHKSYKNNLSVIFPEGSKKNHAIITIRGIFNKLEW